MLAYGPYDKRTMRAPGDSTDSTDSETLPLELFARMSHRGRMVRVFVALALTVFGLLWPAPYIGWTWCLVWFAPAAVLLVFAGMERHSRRSVMICALPTVAGLVLAGVSAFWLARRVGSAEPLAGIFVASLVTSLLAALLGRPPSGA